MISLGFKDLSYPQGRMQSLGRQRSWQPLLQAIQPVCRISCSSPLSSCSGFCRRHSRAQRQKQKNPQKTKPVLAVNNISPAVCAPPGSNSAATASPSSYPKYHRLLPCPLEGQDPRVEHMIADETGNVVEIISKRLDLPRMYVEDLIRFGAIHCALVCPTPPPTATTEQVQLFKRVTAPIVLKKRPSLKGKTVREAQKTFRISSISEEVEAGSYLRVHVHPKRFPRCYEIDWQSRVIAETESYVILDKPVGTSVGGTSDNIYETCAKFTSLALGLKIPLRTTHQLDNCTEGCVVLSKTLEFCSEFHAKLRERRVQKLYSALASAPVPFGILTHYMRPTNIVPRIVRNDATEGWQQCQLEVLECKQIPWPLSAVQASVGIQDCIWPYKESAYECKVKLLTGRTHQIRAQFAAIGAPLIGDTIYMPAAIRRMETSHVYPFTNVDTKEDRHDENLNAAIDQWILQHGKEPTMAIGLQASEIAWDDCEYKAGSPWWRFDS